LGKLVVRRIMELNASKHRIGTRKIGFKPLAKWFKDEINCDEEDFVLVLMFLKKFFPKYYNSIEIPRAWDGGAHEKFPHLFLKGAVAELIAIRDIPQYLTDDGFVGPFEKDSTFKIGIKHARNLIKRGFARPVNLDI